WVNQGDPVDFSMLTYLYQARLRRDQAPGTPSEEFSQINYFLGAYEKPALAFRYLEYYLGKNRLDSSMQSFYEKWKFRHPGPSDLRDHLQSDAGTDLGWLFDGFLYSTGHMDYAIKTVKPGRGDLQVSLSNRGSVESPVLLAGLLHGEVQDSVWVEGFEGVRTVDFPSGNYDQLVLDHRKLSLEVNRKNNYYRLGSPFPKLEKIQLRALPGLETAQRTNLFLSPFISWNNYDKTMIGAAIYNPFLPPRQFNFALAPLYGTGSRQLSGFGHVRWQWYPDIPALYRISVGTTFRSAQFDNPPGENPRYMRLDPKLRIELSRSPTDKFRQQIQWRSIYLRREIPRFESTFVWEDDLIHELSYRAENRRALNPYSFGLALERQSYDDASGDQHYLKLSLEGSLGWNYQPGNRVHVRLFGGFFLDNTRRDAANIAPGAFSLAYRGRDDYRFDGYYLGRNDADNIWSQQVTHQDGHMKFIIDPTATDLGRSNNFLLALNLSADLPIGLPIRPYFDLGYFDSTRQTADFGDQLVWSGGIDIRLFNGLINVYAPLLSSRNIRD
ncbi:MAG: hypothetical protein R3350_10960, partial [Saprospiraceae bacterium]|nr:hypothetical protein [Saprospiraceae bacterium]